MKSRIVELLRRVDWGGLGVSLVVVHGSVLWSENPRDVDLVVVVRRDVDSEEVGLKIMEIVEKVAGLEPDLYVVTDPLYANCFLLLEAFGKGVVVYRDDYGCEMFVKIVNICYDFMLARRAVGYTETLVRRVMEDVAREAS